MPSLSAEFGLLPWHFGGDAWLTYEEANAYIDTHHEIAAERRRAARSA